MLKCGGLAQIGSGITRCSSSFCAALINKYKIIRELMLEILKEVYYKIGC